MSHSLPNPALKIMQWNLNRSTFVVWEMKRNMSVARLIVATQSSGPPASGKIIKEMPGSVASGTPYTFPSVHYFKNGVHFFSRRKEWTRQIFVSEKYNTLHRICQCFCSLNIFKIRYNLCKKGTSYETMLFDTICEAPSLWCTKTSTLE